MTNRIRLSPGLHAALLCLLLLCGVCLTFRPAAASGILNAAAASANQGLNACSSNTGKALYDCVANVLDRMSSDVSRVRRVNLGETSRSLSAAASGLRSAVNKAQALSAIAQCRSAIAGALRQVKALAGGMVPGWGDSGLSSVAAVLARAAQMIQAKG